MTPASQVWHMIFCCWLVGRLFGWLVGWLVVWLVGRLVGWLADGLGELLAEICTLLNAILVLYIKYLTQAIGRNLSLLSDTL